MKNTWILLALLLVIPFSSCNKFLDVNKDPFLPQEAQPHLYLPQLVYAMGEGPMFDVRFIGRYVQYWQQTTANDNYDRMGRRAVGGGLVGSQTYRNHYWAIGSNLNQIQRIARQRGFRSYQGICTAIRAYSWQISTDLFGEMPYRQAWDNTLATFEYDSQKFIYQETDKLCDQALRELDDRSGTPDPNLPRFESIYGGDTDKWKRFVFAIKARLANHISNKRSYNPQRVIELVDQAFRNNDDDALLRFTTTAGVRSDFYSFMGPSRANFNANRQGRMIVNLLNGTHFNNVTDPRLLGMFMPNATTNVVHGLVPTQGIPAGQAANFPTIYGKYIHQDGAPYPLVTYAELQFIKAEAAFRLGNRQLAYTAFVNGIRAHMERVGIAPAAINSYLQTAIPQNGTDLQLRHIMSQKYIALYGQIEIWSDLRRYNYDGNIFMGFQIPTNLAVENNGKPVQRMLPPSFSEEDWNSANFRANGGYDVDYHTKPMWFATNED